MKKKYFAPEMEEMEVEDLVVMVGSPSDDCPGDVEPEPVPGCKTQVCDDF